jgi:hypothetical protein
MTHKEIQDEIKFLLQGVAVNIETEYKLPNGKIADVYCEVEGIQVIVEVKTELKQSLLENILTKYGDQCDILIVATPPTYHHLKENEIPLSWPNEQVERIGIWHIDWLNLIVMRQPQRLERKKTGCLNRGSLSPSLSTVIGPPACTVKEG